MIRDKTLSVRSKYCVLISSLMASGDMRFLSRWFKKGIQRENLPVVFFEEMMIHLSLVLGYPSMLEGMRFLALARGKKSLKRRQRDSVTDKNEKGFRILQKVYGAQSEPLLMNLQDLHPEFSHWIGNEVYGRIFSRRGLTLKERELLNVSVLLFQNYEVQLYSHLRGAIRVGTDLKSLRKIIDCMKNSLDGMSVWQGNYFRQLL